MTNDRTGGLLRRGEKFAARVRIGKSRRVSFTLACKTDKEASARAEVMAHAASDLLAAGRAFEVDRFLKLLATASTEKAVAVIQKAVVIQCSKGGAVNPRAVTIQQWGEKWTGGELARLYPDHVKAKSSSGNDAGLLAKHVYPEVGAVPVERFTLEHAERVMECIPEKHGSSWRRHVAQAMARLLKIAVYPGKLIEHSPIPPSFLPKITNDKAKSFLYPEEDERLMACPDVPFAYRLLYGLLAREGLRVGEALALKWTDLDLKKGTIRLDANKTDSPRAWAMAPGTKEALALRKGGSGPFDGMPEHYRIASCFRTDLKRAGVTRAELFETSKNRRPIRVHDLRATFVTLNLADGKTEAWISDRTGHKSSGQINGYKRTARMAAELGLGSLKPLNEALTACPGGGIKVGSKTTIKGPKRRME